MKSKEQKARLLKLEGTGTGGVVTQTEEESKNRGNRTNSKFVYDLNPLCPNSESEITKPGVVTAQEGSTQEGAGGDTPMGNRAMSTVLATHAQDTHSTSASNADKVVKGIVRVDEQHAEVALSAQTDMGIGSKKDEDDVSLISPRTEAYSEERNVTRVKASKTD